jgi:branched-chain amino acid transport system ATP-binding protein
LSQAVVPESERWPGDSLRATAVSRSFEGIDALRDVTIELRRGEVLGLIGPNGAGKTTLVNVMTGFDRPSSGSVELEGRDITTWAPHRRGRAGVARTFQSSHSFGNLSVRENVEVSALGAGAGSRDARRRAARLIDLLGLERAAEEQASVLSHGEERKLEVARALAIEPRFVLLDEPAAGLPEAEIPEFAEVLLTVRRERGAGVMLIDHNMALVMGVCDSIHVLDRGRTLAEGTPDEVRGNLDVTAAYLGESAVAEEAAGDGGS